MSRSPRGFRMWAAVALLCAMCLGSTFHFLHHFVDHDCDAVGKHGSTPCAACSVMHGGATAAQAVILAPQAPSAVSRLTLGDVHDGACHVVVAGNPRAPPTS